MLIVSQLTPAPVSHVTGMPNALLSLMVLGGVLWMYHGRQVSRGVDSSRRFGTFLIAFATLINIGAAIVGRYWFFAVWSEPLFKGGCAILVLASLTERKLWHEAFDVWGRMHVPAGEPVPQMMQAPPPKH